MGFAASIEKDGGDCQFGGWRRAAERVQAAYGGKVISVDQISPAGLNWPVRRDAMG